MTTIRDEIASIPATYLTPNYTAVDFTNYFDATFLTPVTPTGMTPDRVAQLMIEAVMYCYSRNLPGYNLPPASNLELSESVYERISQSLGSAITSLTAVKTAIDAHVTVLTT